MKVELVEAADDEPVIFSFFPGVNEKEGWKISEDANAITFRNVTLTLSEPVRIERDFKLYNPYQGSYTVGTKPLRAWVELKKHRPFLIGIRVGK